MKIDYFEVILDMLNDYAWEGEGQCPNNNMDYKIQ
jgi:hypothetical protein